MMRSALSLGNCQMSEQLPSKDEVKSWFAPVLFGDRDMTVYHPLNHNPKVGGIEVVMRKDYDSVKQLADERMREIDDLNKEIQELERENQMLRGVAGSCQMTADDANRLSWASQPPGDDQDAIIKSLCDRLERINQHCYIESLTPQERLMLIERISGGFMTPPPLPYLGDAVTKTEQPSSSGTAPAQASETAEAGHSHETKESLEKTLFAAIAHGDDKHRTWLKQAIEDHFSGRPVSQPDKRREEI